MDVRFKNIPPKSSGFTISVVFSGIFIADVSNHFFFEFMMKHKYLFVMCIVNYTNDFLIKKIVRDTFIFT